MYKRIPKTINILILLFIILNTFSFLFFNLAYSPSSAATWKNPTDNLQIKIPGLDKFSDVDCSSGTCKVPWIGEYIAGIYKYAIGIVGILATVVMMVGGVMWIVAGGNATRIGEAKAWIGAALTGLVLALTSYVILYQVNPQLTQLKPIKIETIDGKSISDKIETNIIGCPVNLYPEYCQACDGCMDLAIPYKDGGKVNQYLKYKLESVYSNGLQNWQVTEAWPPTVIHKNDCHYNGTCVDVNFNNQSTSPEDVKILYQAFADYQLNPVYEHNSDCSPYTAQGINCQVVPGINAPHFSIYN